MSGNGSVIKYEENDAQRLEIDGKMADFEPNEYSIEEILDMQEHSPTGDEEFSPSSTSFEDRGVVVVGTGGNGFQENIP